MVIYQYPSEEKLNIPDCVLALGFFDGVHIAHRDLISTARERAKIDGLKFGIFTFASSGKIKESSGRIYGDREKTEIFEGLGADFTVFADFSAISGASPEQFVKSILWRDLKCRVCVAGFNFKFGRGASGDAKSLSALMQDCGGEAIIREEIKGEDGRTLSATLIREKITSGKLAEANKILGSPYYIKGRVLHGRAVGRGMGIPTLNVEVGDERIIPPLGVYASAIPIDGKIYLGVTNLGTCPTFEKRKIHLETHVLDYEGDLYGREINTFLLGFIREEMTFPSPKELKMQINVDKNRVIKEFGDKKWQELGLK